MGNVKMQVLNFIHKRQGQSVIVEFVNKFNSFCIHLERLHTEKVDFNTVLFSDSEDKYTSKIEVTGIDKVSEKDHQLEITFYDESKIIIR